MSVQDYGRVPFIPKDTLAKHKVHEPHDTRFRAAARLRQALHREQHALPIGTYQTAKGERRKLGNYLTQRTATAGNFISPDIAKLVRRELAYREDGALYDETRLFTNLLSSHPATFNILGPLKLNLQLATDVFRLLLPTFVDEVTGILFEHSPSRRDPAFTNDRTAFDALIQCRTVQGKSGFIAIELKYTETMREPPAALRPRYFELSRTANLYNDPDNPLLTVSPLQQFWWQHLLAFAMIGNGLYDEGRFIVIAPTHNTDVARAVRLYQRQLTDRDDSVRFDTVTIEAFVKYIRSGGATKTAKLLHARYCDYTLVDALIA